jgi:hypothetical protein
MLLTSLQTFAFGSSGNEARGRRREPRRRVATRWKTHEPRGGRVLLQVVEVGRLKSTEGGFGEEGWGA